MNLIWIGIGGTFGSVTRYQLGKVIADRSKSPFPKSTFIINIAGAILLGIATGTGVDGGLYLLIADGFLGAFTTFSTFMYEGFSLFKENEKKNAVVYIIGTLILGILGYTIGHAIVRL
jgi:CrcB protein